VLGLWGVLVWRSWNDAFKFAIGREILDLTIVGLDDAVEFVMTHGWK
jgi:hypothetical protein